MTLMGVVYGFFIQRYKVFPYRHIAIAYHFIIHTTSDKVYGPWSIGVYEGSSPFDLAASDDISNPILTGKDIVDIDATFVADPFLVLTQNKYTMFFEVMNRETSQADIGYAESTNGKIWEYKMGGAMGISNHRYHGILNSAQECIADGQAAGHCRGKYVGGLTAGWDDFFDDRWFIKRSVVTYCRNEVCYLKGCNQGRTLTNGKVGRIQWAGWVRDIPCFFVDLNACGLTQAETTRHIGDSCGQAPAEQIQADMPEKRIARAH